MTTEGFRPRRTVLYMPSSNERALEKAKTLAVDALILDLEDAVAPDAKPQARLNAAAAVKSGEYGAKELTIRINGADTEWHAEDLKAAAEAGPDAIVVPKVNSAEQVRELIASFEAAGVPEHTKLWAMIESPQAILDAREILGASDRLTVAVLGTNDLVKELFVDHVVGRTNLVTSLQLAVLAARATGKVILDGVYNDVKNAEGFLAEVEQGRQFGFDGKTIIHPGQIEPANEGFAPSAEAIDNAKGLIEAFESSDGGVVTYNGKMVENLHVESAKRTLSIAAAIEALQA
ncbi:HpcH/HpaI aldolase/citrate lyase family protein [Nocardioides jiangxiensis]|uniref:CoA ester lyase n=1 Tax=Nocardioides jiangxiensis TaxID=3064524 RepID=A0ABT9B8P8_9ACTN|nr:CoA ester lyase [Nocardioides sp. WY-20]MDO7869523.1 CoA ester lyase [Nocardioides sp. WY-20]